MLRVHLAELRGAATAWLGVSVVFVVVNFCFTLLTLTVHSGDVAIADGTITFEQSAGYTITPVLLLVMTAFVAWPVVSSATGLVVNARRGSLARLALAGASPRQVTGTITTQLIGAALVCAALGDAIAAAVLGGYLESIAASQNGGFYAVRIDPSYGAEPFALGSGVCVLLAVVAGHKEARRAATIPPVEALRESQAASAPARMRVGGWIGAALLTLVLVGCFASVPVQLAYRYKETVSNLFMMSAFVPYLSGLLLFLLLPLLMQPVLRGWTALVPATPSWQLARASVIARAERFRKSTTPVMFTIGIAIATLGLSASFMETLRIVYSYDMSAGGVSDLVLMLGLPILVAFAGSVGSMLMMSRQRDAELALVGIAGATPGQRLLLPWLEAVIITVTAALLAIVMVAPGYAFEVYALTMAGLPFRLVIPWVPVGETLLFCLAITSFATVVPTLPARGRPEPRVIARLIAE